MQLSKLEHKAYELLRKNNLVTFRTKDIVLLMNVKKTKAYNLIKSLKKKNAIECLSKGSYLLQGTNELMIGSGLNWPSYLSFWSALSYYGFTEQLPKTMFYATTKYRKNIGNYKYITLSKKRFFGYANINGLIIAEKEKAITDSLLFPKYSGGIDEIIRCVEAALNELDISKLVDYAIKIESKAVLRRLGFILEKIGCRKKLNEIEARMGKGYELLDPTLKKKNNLNKKWLLDVNNDIS